MNNTSVVILGLLVLLYLNGCINLTQALLIGALASESSCCNQIDNLSAT